MRHAIRRGLASITLRQIRFRRHRCPLCRRTRLFVKLANDETGVRCTHCRATPVTLSLVSILLEMYPDLAQKSVYELSSRGALFEFLLRNAGSVTGSEYFADVAPGAWKGAIQCQDVQALTHASDSFDICTSTEVFEHVPDDARGFSEIHRVLRPGGIFVFTVPINIHDRTIERARLSADGNLEHLLPAEYHGDPVGNAGRILAFRNYGADIVDRLLASGFDKARIQSPDQPAAWGYHRAVIVASKTA
ncbi:MAG: class I SAM-dependent methyltransferase [Chromatocurvus sp.]